MKIEGLNDLQNKSIELKQDIIFVIVNNRLDLYNSTERRLLDKALIHVEDAVKLLQRVDKR
jgi:hypothetical protein